MGSVTDGFLERRDGFMSLRTEDRAPSASSILSGAVEEGTKPVRGGPQAGPLEGNADIIGEVNGLAGVMGRDLQFIRKIREFGDMTLVLSATDTGREIAITLDGQGVHARLYQGGRFDVKIRATEQVHWEVLSGETDADEAFFAGRVNVSGSIVTAFRLKNGLLPLLQAHLGSTRDAMGRH